MSFTVVPSQVVLAYVVSQGLASTGTPPWLGTFGQLPEDDVDDRVSVTDSGGIPDGRNFRTGLTVVRPQVQVRVRSKVYKDGQLRLLAIQDALQSNQGTVVLVGSVPVFLGPLSLSMPVAYMGESEKRQRSNFAFTGSIPPLA